MTDQELIELAKMRAAAYSARPNVPVQLSRLPNIRVRQAFVVCFEGEPADGRIEVILDRESGSWFRRVSYRPRRAIASCILFIVEATHRETAQPITSANGHPRWRARLPVAEFRR